MKKQTQDIPINQALLDIITPIGVEEKLNSLVVGDSLCKVHGIVQYPTAVDYGWLARLTNMPGTVAAIEFNPIDNGAFLDSLSRSIKQKRGDAESVTDPLVRQRAEKAAEDGEALMERIDQRGETVGILTTTVVTMGRDLESWRRQCRRTESGFAFLKCKARGLAGVQLAGFKHTAPYHPPQPVVEEMFQRVMPLSSFMGGFPFSSSGLNDGAGYHFAKDNAGGLIILDPWYRGGDRTNTGFVIMGVAGVGKSTAVKHIAISEYMRGTKVLFIDPENEYGELCDSLCGDRVNASGGKGGRINPLQIRPAPIDDEDETDKLYQDEGHGMGDMALHMKTLEVFFGLYLPSLTDMHKAILKDTLVELYRSHSIDWDTNVSHLHNKDFPILSDLYELLAAKSESRKGKELEQTMAAELALLLKDAALGSDSFLWNGHSTIHVESSCVVLNTHGLDNTSDNVKRAQYFNLLLWCWQEMSRSRDERVLLICDEAYLMIDPNVPQSLVFLRNVEKRARKYEAGVMIVSHSVVDFLDPSIKKYGQALLDIPAYKILMGADGMNLKETAELYGLTDAEQDLLMSKQRKNALLIVGAKRLHVVFELPEYKLEAMGKAGGR